MKLILRQVVKAPQDRGLPPGPIYAGPALPGRIVAGMIRLAEQEGVASISDLRDTRLAEWAARPL